MYTASAGSQMFLVETQIQKCLHIFYPVRHRALQHLQVRKSPENPAGISGAAEPAVLSTRNSSGKFDLSPFNITQNHGETSCPKATELQQRLGLTWKYPHTDLGRARIFPNSGPANLFVQYTELQWTASAARCYQAGAGHVAQRQRWWLLA